MGSNAIRFVIAEYQDYHHYKIIHREREPIRLAPSSDHPDLLADEPMRQAICFFRKSQAKLHDFQVLNYRAVATSAVRESTNSQVFCDRAMKESGIRLEVIDTVEEARLMYIAVKNKVSLLNHHWHLFDIGGGSIQVSYINAERVIWTASRPLGAVRLWERFKDLPKVYPSLVAYIHQELAQMKLPVETPVGDFHECFATGGSVEEATRLVNQTFQQGCPDLLSIEQLRATRELLASLSIEQRMEQLGMAADRADIMLPAIVLVEEFCSLFHFPSLLIPYTSLREGILWEIADEYFSNRFPS